MQLRMAKISFLTFRVYLWQLIGIICGNNNQWHKNHQLLRSQLLKSAPHGMQFHSNYCIQQATSKYNHNHNNQQNLCINYCNFHHKIHQPINIFLSSIIYNLNYTTTVQQLLWDTILQNHTQSSHALFYHSHKNTQTTKACTKQ
jgi:hypothetical protein